MAFVSVDDVKSHIEWKKDVNETQNTSVDFPIIGDEERRVATLYDMIDENASATAPVSSVFFIGPEKKIKASIVYPTIAGRNFEGN